MAQPFYAELLRGFPVVVVQDVAWGEMDAYQHVNNAVYFRYFENARLAYFQRIGWHEAKEVSGLGPILRDTQARYRLALTYPDTIAIGARAQRVEPDRVHLEHKIASRRLGAIVTEGHGTIVSYDYAADRKVALPDEIRAAIARLEGGSPS